MKDFATKYLEKYNGFGKIVKILLCLLWDIPSGLYRFSKSALKDNTLGMILAVVLTLCGGWIMFIIDIVTLALKDQLLWLADLGISEEKMATTFSSDEEKAEEEAPAEEKAETPAEESAEAPAEESAEAPAEESAEAPAEAPAEEETPAEEEAPSEEEAPAEEKPEE